jgi:hypothetical protein
MASSSFIATARGIVQRQSTLVKSARAGMRTSSSDGLLIGAGAGATITSALVTQLYSSHFNTTTLASAHSSLRQDYNLSAKVWGFSQ